MSSDEAPTGRCLCGAISLRAGAGFVEVLHCHCENCRRITGNYVAACRTATDQLEIADPEGLLRHHELGYARYGFCSGCGSTLYFRPQEDPGRTSVMTGVLDDVASLPLGSVWFAHDRQPHNPEAVGVPHHAGNNEASP